MTQEPMANRTPPLISDLLKQTLAIRDSSGKASGPNVEIPLQRLESMAAEVSFSTHKNPQPVTYHE